MNTRDRSKSGHSRIYQFNRQLCIRCFTPKNGLNSFSTAQLFATLSCIYNEQLTPLLKKRRFMVKNTPFSPFKRCARHVIVA